MAADSRVVAALHQGIESALRCFSPVVGADGRAMGAVVVGYLLQLGHVDQAVELIQQENEAGQTLLQELLELIENKPVVGLILGKFSRARELGVTLELDPDSALGEYPAAVSADLINPIGNLPDNGLQAAWRNRQQCPPRVLLSLCGVGHYEGVIEWRRTVEKTSRPPCLAST